MAVGKSRIQVMMSDELIADIDATCERLCISRGGLISVLVDQGLRSMQRGASGSWLPATGHRAPEPSGHPAHGPLDFPPASVEPSPAKDEHEEERLGWGDMLVDFDED